MVTLQIDFVFVSGEFKNIKNNFNFVKPFDSSDSMAKFLGINRLTKLFQIIRESGGLRATYLKLYR